MSLKDEFLTRHKGNVSKAADDLTEKLMRGDPAEFKVGYTAENAVIAAVELFHLSDGEARLLAHRFGADEALVAGFVTA